MTTASQSKHYQLSAETITAMKELGDVLADIYQSLKRQGYSMVDGEIIKIIQHEEYPNQPSQPA